MLVKFLSEISGVETSYGLAGQWLGVGATLCYLGLQCVSCTYHGRGHRSGFTIAGENVPFSNGRSRLIEKVKVKMGKPVTAQCRKIQAVTTLRWFQCDAVEVCYLPNVVALVC